MQNKRRQQEIQQSQPWQRTGRVKIKRTQSRHSLRGLRLREEKRPSRQLSQNGMPRFSRLFEESSNMPPQQILQRQAPGQKVA